MAEDKSEKKNDADEGNSSQNNGDQELEDIEESDDIDSVVANCSQEYTALDQTINNLNSALNSLEERNEGLYAKVLELLQDNQEVHQQIITDKNKENSDKSHDEGKS